jgi:hypothetical protein
MGPGRKLSPLKPSLQSFARNYGVQAALIGSPLIRLGTYGWRWPIKRDANNKQREQGGRDRLPLLAYALLGSRASWALAPISEKVHS